MEGAHQTEALPVTGLNDAMRIRIQHCRLGHAAPQTEDAGYGWGRKLCKLEAICGALDGANTRRSRGSTLLRGEHEVAPALQRSDVHALTWQGGEQQTHAQVGGLNQALIDGPDPLRELGDVLRLFRIHRVNGGEEDVPAEAAEGIVERRQARRALLREGAHNGPVGGVGIVNPEEVLQEANRTQIAKSRTDVIRGGAVSEKDYVRH